MQEKLPPRTEIGKVQDNSTNQEEISEIQRNLQPQAEIREVQDISTNQEEISKIQKNLPPKEEIHEVKENITKYPPQEVHKIQEDPANYPPQKEISETHPPQGSQEDHGNQSSQEEIDGSQETHPLQEEIPKIPLCPSPEDNIINVQDNPTDFPPQEEIPEFQQSLNDIPLRREISGSREDLKNLLPHYEPHKDPPSQEEIPKVKLCPSPEDNIINVQDNPTDHGVSQEEITKGKQDHTNNPPHKKISKSQSSQEEIINIWDSTDHPPMEEIHEILRSISTQDEMVDDQENLAKTQYEVDMCQTPTNDPQNVISEIQPSVISLPPQKNTSDNLPVQQALKNGKSFYKCKISYKILTYSIITEILYKS